MTETAQVTVIAKESSGKKDKKRNLWKMFRRKKSSKTTSTSTVSSLQKQTKTNKTLLGKTVMYCNREYFVLNLCK